MTVNLLQIIDQLRKFIQQENWSWFSLFLYFMSGLMIGDRVLERLLKYGFPHEDSYLIVWIIVLSFISIWFFTRGIHTKDGKINIGIADLTIIHIADSQLTYEQKLQLASESSQYLYNQIQNEVFDGTNIKQINLIKLPSRVQVNFENDREVADHLDVDILVRGTLKFVEGKYLLDYKVTCSKKVESWAFAEIIQNINASDDIVFDFHNTSKKLVGFAHQLLWLGLLLHATEDMAAARFLSAHTTIESVLERIKKLPIKEHKGNMYYLVCYLYSFCSMRNLIMMQDANAKKKDHEGDGTRLPKHIKEDFVQVIYYLKSYFAIEKEQVEDNQQFSLEFLYALSRNPYREWHDDAVFVYKEAEMLPGLKELLSGYFSLIDNNLIDAKLTYQAILTQDHDNMVALRSLGIIEYRLKNYALAKHHLENYWKNNNQHIFYRHYRDTRVLKLLSLCSLCKLHLIDALQYYAKYLLAKFNNHKLKKKYVVL